MKQLSLENTLASSYCFAKLSPEDYIAKWSSWGIRVLDGVPAFFNSAKIAIINDVVQNAIGDSKKLNEFKVEYLANNEQYLLHIGCYGHEVMSQDIVRLHVVKKKQVWPLLAILDRAGKLDYSHCLALDQIEQIEMGHYFSDAGPDRRWFRWSQNVGDTDRNFYGSPMCQAIAEQLDKAFCFKKFRRIVVLNNALDHIGMNNWASDQRAALKDICSLSSFVDLFNLYRVQERRYIPVGAVLEKIDKGGYLQSLDIVDLRAEAVNIEDIYKLAKI